MDPYNVLGCTPSTPLEEIETAYRLLLRQHHPDLHHGEGADAVMTAEHTTRELNLAMAAIREGRGNGPARGPTHRRRYEPGGDFGRRGGGFGGYAYSGPDQWQTRRPPDPSRASRENGEQDAGWSSQTDEQVPCPYCGAYMGDLDDFHVHLAEVHRLHDRIPPPPHSRPQPQVIEALGKLRFLPAGLVVLVVLLSVLLSLPAWVVLPEMIFLLLVVWAQASPRFKRRPTIAHGNPDDS